MKSETGRARDGETKPQATPRMERSSRYVRGMIYLLLPIARQRSHGCKWIGIVLWFFLLIFFKSKIYIAQCSCITSLSKSKSNVSKLNYALCANYNINYALHDMSHELQTLATEIPSVYSRNQEIISNKSIGFIRNNDRNFWSINWYRYKLQNWRFGIGMHWWIKHQHQLKFTLLTVENNSETNPAANPLYSPLCKI